MGFISRSAATLAVLVWPAVSFAQDIVVFAAASMKNTLDAVVVDFEEKTGQKVAVSYAGSNVLARQIIEGAPAEIFISAASDWMDTVEAEGLLAPQTRRDLLGNRLVLVSQVSDTAPVDLSKGADLVGRIAEGRLAMGTVNAVPAGQYGKAALENLEHWQAVQNYVIQTDNVRAALNFVALGEVGFGVVYASDTVNEPRVRIAATFPLESHPPIVYPVALTKSATPGAVALYEALSQPPATEIFEAAGFDVLK